MAISKLNAMKISELNALLENAAASYRRKARKRLKLNQNMNDLSAADLRFLKTTGRHRIQRILDALLVDFINYVAGEQCVDLALCTRHITGTRKAKTGKQ